MILAVVNVLCISCAYGEMTNKPDGSFVKVSEYNKVHADLRSIWLEAEEKLACIHVRD